MFKGEIANLVKKMEDNEESAEEVEKWMAQKVNLLQERYPNYRLLDLKSQERDLSYEELTVDYIFSDQDEVSKFELLEYSILKHSNLF